jgi:hypothetical protein
MTNMLTGLIDETNIAFTENGGQSFATTKSYVLDLFALGGSLRSRQDEEISIIFDKALGEDKLLSTKTMFYFRDVRGGQGERNTFRVMLKHLARVSPDTVVKNLDLIPQFGRWDDLYALIDTPVANQAMVLIKKQFDEDMLSEHPSLLGKWLKSENTSSEASKKLGRLTRKLLGLTPKQYRQSLTLLRTKIGIVEQNMSANKWSDISYGNLPSVAGFKYTGSFHRHDGIRYANFLADVAAGETTINSSTLFPYDIVRKALRVMQEQQQMHVDSVLYADQTAKVQSDMNALNVMWDNLPNYVGDESQNALAVVDVSPSMEGLPKNVAISLGLYLAEHSVGPYRDHFITFAEQPAIVKVSGSTFVEKVRNITESAWGISTNIEAVFDLILGVAIKNKISQDDMIEKLYIISDMEFDRISNDTTNWQDTQQRGSVFRVIRAKYEAAGYKLPALVFWNVDARNNQVPATMDDSGVQLVSGCSPALFTSLISGKDLSAIDLMMHVLNDERYNSVTI